MCGGHLAVLSAVDSSAPPGLEPLRARGAGHILLGGVGAALGGQRLLRGVSLCLLPAAAADAHALLLQQDPAGHQGGE